MKKGILLYSIKFKTINYNLFTFQKEHIFRKNICKILILNCWYIFLPSALSLRIRPGGPTSLVWSCLAHNLLSGSWQFA